MSSWYSAFLDNENLSKFMIALKNRQVCANGYAFKPKSSWKRKSRIVFLFGLYMPIIKIRITLMEEALESAFLSSENYVFSDLDMNESNKLDLSTLKKVHFETLGTSFIALSCSNLECDKKFVLAADNRTKSLLLFNHHLRVVNQIKIDSMIANFPYIKVKNCSIAYITNLESMTYNFLG